MKHFVVVLLLMLTLAGCNRSHDMQPVSEATAGGYSFGEPEKNNRLQAELKRQGVMFWTSDDSDTVNYKLIDVATVLGAVREINTGGAYDPNVFESAPFVFENEYKIFKRVMERENIPFEENTYEGRTNIYWSQVYGPQVDALVQEAMIEGYRERFAAQGGKAKGRLSEPPGAERWRSSQATTLKKATSGKDRAAGQ